MNSNVSLAAPLPADVLALAVRPDEGLEAIMPALRALDSKTLIHCFSHPIATSGQVLAHLARIRSLDGAMQEQLPRFDRSLVAMLAPCAIALADVHARALARRAPVEGGRERLAAARKLRARLHLSAAFLVQAGSLPENVLARLARHGHGYNDTSKAILAYVEAHFAKDRSLRARSPSTREELESAREEAMALAVSHIDRTQRDPTDLALADLERRVYHLLVTTYNKVRSAVQFLRYDFGDADDFAPAIGHHARSSRRAAR